MRSHEVLNSLKKIWVIHYCDMFMYNPWWSNWCKIVCLYLRAMETAYHLVSQLELNDISEIQYLKWKILLRAFTMDEIRFWLEWRTCINDRAVHLSKQAVQWFHKRNGRNTRKNRSRFQKVVFFSSDHSFFGEIYSSER